MNQIVFLTSTGALSFLKHLCHNLEETLGSNFEETNYSMTSPEVYVYDLDLFVTVQLFEDTLAVLSLGSLCEEHGYTCERASGQKATPDQSREENSLQY